MLVSCTGSMAMQGMVGTQAGSRAAACATLRAATTASREAQGGGRAGGESFKSGEAVRNRIWRAQSSRQSVACPRR